MIQIWFGILLNCCCCCSLRNMNIKVMPWQWQFRCHMARAFVEESIILFSGEEFLSLTNIFALFKCHTLDSWGTSVTSFFYCNIFNVAYNFHISSFWFIYILKLTFYKLERINRYKLLPLHLVPSFDSINYQVHIWNVLSLV